MWMKYFFSSHWEVGSSMNCFFTEGGGAGHAAGHAAEGAEGGAEEGKFTFLLGI